MAKAETATRAPRGTKPVSQAFFTALETIPEAMRSAVAKAAQTMIRDELKMRGEKVRAATAKAKVKTSASAKTTAPKPAVSKVATKAKTAPIIAAAPVKSRGRKSISVRAAT